MKYPLKDTLQACIRVAGIFVPTRYIWRPFGELLEVDRCVVDGGFVTDSQRSLSQHLGHKLQGKVRINIFQMILIWLRIIR